MLQKKGHNVTVFVHDFNVDDVQESILDNIRVVRFSPRRTNASSFLGYNAYLSYEFADVIKQYIIAEGQPTIIEAQEYGGIAYYLQQFKLLGYPEFQDLNILITCHAPAFLYLEYNHEPTYKFPNYWIGQMEKSSIRSADILITPSLFLTKELKKKMSWEGVKEHHVVNPIETVSSIQNSPDFEQNYIVCFGKLSPLKGSFELLKYFDKLWQQGLELPLHIIGSTQQVFHPEGRTMEDVIKHKYKLYIEKGLLKLRGQMSPEQSKRELLGAHIVLVPSIVDNLPYTVLEAMRLGKVVLASKQGGQREVIDHANNGYLFDHSIPGDFQDKLLHILSLTTKRIKEVGDNAIHSIRENYNQEVVYSQKMKVIDAYFFKKENRSDFPFLEPIERRTIAAHHSGEEKNLLSVVIPYYNMGAYIEDCVQSVLACDYSNMEVLIIDDGSNEKASVDMLSYIQSKYPVAVYRKENEGLPLTRNFGADKAKGEFLAFLDADDMIEVDYYSKATRVLSMYDNVHFVGCWAKYFEGGRGYWPTFNPEPPYLLVHNMVNSSALIYKTNSFLISGLNNPAFVYGMEDWDSVISMVEKGYRGVVLPEALFNYRVRKGSMSRSFTKVKELYLNKLIASNHADLFRKYGVEIAYILNSNGSGLEFDNPTFESISGYLPLSNALKGRIKEKVKQNKILKSIALKLYKIKN